MANSKKLGEKKSSNNVTVEFLNHNIPKIIIPYEVYCDICDIVKSTKDEVGWIGEVEKEEGEVYRVGKVTVPEQEAHGTTTEIKDVGISSLIESKEIDMSKWFYWGHSHGHMGVFASSQDDDTMKSFSESCPWYIGTIHNHDEDIYGYVIDRTTGLYYKDVEVVIEGVPEKENKWKAIVDERVKPFKQQHIGKYPRKTRFSGWNSEYGGGYGGWSAWDNHPSQQQTKPKINEKDEVLFYEIPFTEFKNMTDHYNDLLIKLNI